MRRSTGSTIDPGVFWVSLGISMLFVVWGVFLTDNLSAVASAEQSSSLERNAGG